jgi:hypothetical protein
MIKIFVIQIMDAFDTVFNPDNTSARKLPQKTGWGGV